MPKLLAAAALCAALALTAAGCGGDDSSTESAASLQKKATAICTNVVAASRKASEAQKWDEVQTSSQAAIDDLKALKPPKESAEKFNAYVSAQEAVVKANEPLIAALKAKQISKARALIKQNTPLVKAANDAAKAAGLTACAG